MRRLLVAVAVAFLIITPVFSAEITLLSGRDYFKATLAEIEGAKESIYVVMYLIDPKVEDPKDLPLSLVKSLNKASERGVRVTVILEEKKQNKKAFELLPKGSVHFGVPGQFIHDKAIVIDEFVSILGSHNWTAAALGGNSESSVMIRDADFARKLLSALRRIRKTESLTLAQKGIRLPCSFFTGKKSAGSRMYTKHAEKEFDSYLLTAKTTKEAYIEIPLSFWEYGYDKRLSMKAKFFYLINLRERKRSKIFPWWQRRIKDLERIYGISKRSLTGASIELQREDIIEVYRTAPKKMEFPGFRKPNRYLVKELCPEEEFGREIKELEKKYGVRVVGQAKKMADELNEPRDIQVIRTFIDLIQKYGFDKVSEANAETAKLRPHNAKRHIGYTIIILTR